MNSEDEELEDLELRLLLEGVYSRYGYDFREYSDASLKRRIRGLMVAEQLASISTLQDKVLHDPRCMDRLLFALSINVTSMFRDPTVYFVLREKVLPLLRTYPFIRIWHAGCSSGEEVYSLVILLEEEGLYDRCKVYAMNEVVLEKAKAGIFPLSAMQEYTANYQKAGGTQAFSEYYTANYDSAIFQPALRRNMIFAQHNLVTDGSFNEFNLVFCRNVMIYFSRTLQERVHKLIYESLMMFGFLALGTKESIRFTPYEGSYEEIDSRSRVYRRVK